MSSCFNGDWPARPLAWTACLLAMLACGTAKAQIDDGDQPTQSASDGRINAGTTPIRLWHSTRGYGQQASDTAIGARWATDLSGAIGFVDGQFRINNDSRGGGNIGGGFRWFEDSLLTGAPRILGVSGWYDGQETFIDNYFNQMGVSFESLGEFVDFRLNANIPLEERKVGSTTTVSNDLIFAGNSLSQATFTPTDISLRVVDFEVAARVFDLNVWVYGGGYEMDGRGISEFGRKGGVRGYVTNDLVLGVAVTDDDEFGTNTIVQAIWTPGRTGAGPTYWVHTLADRMREQVYRNQYVATQQIQTEGAIALTNTNGSALRIVHVDSAAAAGGDGTAERPLNNLDEIDNNSIAGDIVLAHANSSFTGQTATLQDQQRFLGEGGGITHTVATAQRGTVTLPETFAGALNATRPSIQNAGGDAILLGSTTADHSGFTPVEVSNFTISNVAQAVRSDTNGIGAVNINNLAITNATGNAIQLAALTETLANSTQRLRFQPTINTVTFTGTGGDDIDLNSNPGAQPDAFATTEAIAISNITSTNGGGIGVDLQNTRQVATITNDNWNGGVNGDGGVRVQNSLDAATVTVNGPNTFTTDPAGTGFAFDFENAKSNQTITGTTITNVGGDSVKVNGGDANVTFTGTITQSHNNVAVVDVLGGHTGSLVFNAATAGGDVITATDGNGLQFDNADGTYTFNGGVVMTGVDAGVNVVNGSSGTITLQDSQITNPTGLAIHFDGGTASMTFNGKISQNANVAVVSVTGGHDGTLTFNDLAASPGVIVATAGPGLQFNNADGAYIFNDNVALSGADGAGIAVSNGSNGTFTFADADVTYTAAAGNAVSIDGSNVQAFTHSGDITVTGAGARPVSVTNNTAGSITFNGPITATNSLGLLLNNNTGTTVRFAGQTTLNTAANTAVTLTNHTGGGVRFDNLDVTTTSGTGFLASNVDNLTVLGATNTIATTTGTALNLNDVSIGTAAGNSGMTFESISVSAGTGNGIVLNDVRGGLLTIAGTGATALSGGSITTSGGDAVSITNVARLSINNMSLTSTGAGGHGVNFNVNNSSAESRLGLVNNTITTSGAAAEAVLLNFVGPSAETGQLTLSNNTIVKTGDDDALRLQTDATASLKTINLLAQNNTVSTTSTAAGDRAGNFQSSGGAVLNATVLNNTFTNTGAGSGFEMATNSAGSQVHLDLNGNTAVSPPADDYILVRNGGLGTYEVKDLATVQARNTGTVNVGAGIVTETDPIPLPTAP